MPAENPQSSTTTASWCRATSPGNGTSLSGVERSLEASLGRLGLDFIDVLLVHDPDQAWPGAAQEGLESLAGTQGRWPGEGRRHRHQLRGGPRRAHRGGHHRRGDAGQPVQPADPGCRGERLAPAAAAGVAVVAVGVFGTGLLASPRPRAGATFEYRPADSDALARATAIADICEAHGVDLPTAALAYPLLHPAVTAVALGMRSPDEVDQNVARATTKVPPALWQALADAELVPGVPAA